MVLPTADSALALGAVVAALALLSPACVVRCSAESFVSAPYYPAPLGGGVGEVANAWAESYEKAVRLVSRMTLAEKVNITSGTGMFMGNTGSADRLGFPQLCLQDGPLGLRSTNGTTAFPAGITTGATWDKRLMYRRGVALGKEFRGKGANMFLGPALTMGRKPRGGRSWEAFGTDPVLNAKAGALTVQGVQEQGVTAVIKHFVGNEQEIDRMYILGKPAYSANMADRTLHELYQWPFADCIRAGAGAVMMAYNAVNASAASQNAYLINGMLKDEMTFQGIVMSDWLGHLSGVPAALAGLDLSMPGDTMIPLFGYSYWMYELSRAVLNGSVPVERINDMATRVVATWYKLGQDKDFPPPNFSANTADRVGPLYPGALLSPSGVVNQYVDVRADHNLIGKELAQDAVTLLKNDGNLLPIAPSRAISVFGTAAAPNPDGINSCSSMGCNKGTLTMGWGSGTAELSYLDDPIGSLKRKGASVTYYNTDSFPATVPTPSSDEVAIVFITADSGENHITVEGNAGDRSASGLQAWHHGDELVQKAAAKYSNVIVVLHTVGPVLMEPWISLPSVKAVLVAYLPGCEAGDSLTEIIFGQVSPSGHLPFTIPVSEEDYPDSVKLTGPVLGQPQDTYSEELYIDYRALNKAQPPIPARFAFGHGLSYTSFAFDQATIESVTPLTTRPPPRPSRAVSPVAAMNKTIPAVGEVVEPAGFNRIWRYLYSWLSRSDAEQAYAIGLAGKDQYPYPPGYSDRQPTGAGPASGGSDGGNPALWDVAYTVSIRITNKGGRSGKAVAQAYVQFPDSAAYDTPVLQLRDFDKTRELGPAESQVLTLALTRRDLSLWAVEAQNWVVPVLTGYRIWIGEASDALRAVCYNDGLTCQEVRPDCDVSPPCLSPFAT